MASADGSVIIEIDANDKNALKKLDEVQEKAEKVTDQISGDKEITFSLNVSEAERELGKLKNSIYKLTDDVRYKESLIPGLESKRADIEEQRKSAVAQNQDMLVQSLDKEWDSVNKKIESYRNSIDAANQRIEHQKMRYGEITQAIQTAAAAAKEQSSDAGQIGEIKEKAAVADQSVVALNEELAELKTRLSELDQAGIGLGYEEYDNATRRIGEINQQLRDYRSNLTSTEEETQKTESAAQRAMAKFRELPAQMTRGVASAAKNGLSALKTITSGIVKAVAKLNVFSRVSNKLGSVFQRLGSTIKSALVFSVIYQGLSMVRQQLGSYLMANTQFTSALSQLKGVLLTAFQPIYDYIIPALTALMNVLSSVIAVIGRFISVLFGKTAKQSQANAKALYGQAAATEAAGSAAEDAAGSLAAFDEINTIQTEKAGGGGGGGGGVGAEAGAPDFSYDYGEDVFGSWGEAFSAFLDTILNDGIPKLRAGMLDFADWLNNLSRKLYDMFTFPGVKDKVIQIGQDLANAFNDLVNAINWNQLGMALGAGLNLSILGMVNFLYTFDWINLGMSLAAFINGAVSEIDWYAVGQLLWSGFKIAIETLAGFLLGLNMPELALAASDLVIGFFNSVKDTIDKIDWKQIGEQIRKFLVNIKWKDIADSVFGAIESAFVGSSDFFSGLLGDELKQTLTDLMLALGESLLVVGALLALTGANIPLGLGLMAKGALALGGAAALNWEYVSGNIKKIITEIALLLGTSLLAIGAILVLSGANIPLGIGLLSAGAVSLASAVAVNWTSIVSAIQGTLGGIIAAGSAALLALGLILCLSGVGIPLGIALIAAGAAGLVSVTAINWNAILDKLKGLWTDIRNWWNSSVAKYFSLDYWIQRGKEIISGFIDGIKSKVSGIADAITGAIPKKINVPVMTTSVSSALNVAGAVGKRSAPMPTIAGRSIPALAAGAVGKRSAPMPTIAGRSIPALAAGAVGKRSAPMPTIAGRSIPALAAGAVIPPNREFLAALSDQRSGTNIEAPLSTIEQAVENVFSRMGGSGSGSQTINLVVDGKTLARVIVPAINDMTVSAGKPVLLI